MTYLAGARVLDGWSCAWADYDNDGDLDLAIGSPSGMRLLRNDTPQSSNNHWLVVECVGSQTTSSRLGSIFIEPATVPDTEAAKLSNKSAIGARVTLRAGNSTQIREIQSGKGAGTGNQLIAHFGLGNYEGELELEIRFPSGVVVVKTIPSVNLKVVIQETIPLNLPTNPLPPDRSREVGITSTDDEAEAE